MFTPINRQPSSLTAYIKSIQDRDSNLSNPSPLTPAELFKNVETVNPNKRSSIELFRDVQTTDPMLIESKVQPPYPTQPTVGQEGYSQFTSLPPEPTKAFDLDIYLEKLAHHESRGAKDPYTAGNKSGAYGKYQVLPSTLKEAAKQMGITIKYGNTPEGQEKVIRHLTNNNLKAMKRHGLPETYLGAWAYHNQGTTGGRRIMKYEGKPSTRNMRSNLPSHVATTSPEYLQYWASKWH